MVEFHVCAMAVVLKSDRNVQRPCARVLGIDKKHWCQSRGSHYKPPAKQSLAN